MLNFSFLFNKFLKSCKLFSCGIGNPEFNEQVQHRNEEQEPQKEF